MVGALHVQTADSDTPDSVNSPDQENTEKPPPLPSQQQFPLISIDKRERTVSLSGLDIHSCLQFLLELYGQWLSPNSILKPPLMLKTEVVKSVGQGSLFLFNNKEGRVSELVDFWVTLYLQI